MEGSTDAAFQKTFFDPGVPTILFYDSEIKVTHGKELLENMKLSKKTENRRVFAKCCGTPIAICPDHSHLNLVYSNIITPSAFSKKANSNEIPFPEDVLQNATVCLHASHLETADTDAAKEKYPEMKIVAGAGAPIEIVKIISRLLLLIGMGQRGPGDGFPVGEGKTVGIGYESIPKLMK